MREISEEWHHSDGTVYKYDYYNMLLRLKFPNRLVEQRMEEDDLNYPEDAIYYLVDDYHKQYLSDHVEKFEFEHSNEWDEGESGWKVEAVSYGIKNVDIESLLERKYVREIWLDDEQYGGW